MNGRRYKPVGWRGEPHRHYLAAKGIKTKGFDLSKYRGRYKQREVFNEPWFQQGCDDVYAEYGESDDADLSVRNVCVEDGDVSEIQGTADVVEDGKLEVDFGLFRKGEYEIVAVTPDYENAIVRSGDTVWVLEKTEDDKYFVSKDDPSYKKWRKLVNMAPSEVERFAESELGKKAGLSRKEAREKGIKSGRDSAEAIVRMRKKPLSEWTDTDEEWMNRQNSFVARMKGVEGPLYEDGEKTRKHTALLIWGHDPEKKKPWKGGNVQPALDEL